MKKKFGAFLSHNSQDKPIVEQIALWLEDEAKLRVWLDKWNLVPGEPWQEEIEKALEGSSVHNEKMNVKISLFRM